ncbi:phospho-N-acetylmuramoyl-pentapeptide-transferase [soil metagenome]
MLYALLQLLERLYSPPGFQAFEFITVRASLAAATTLLIGLFAGKRIILYLRRKQIGETVRAGADAGAVSHEHKAGTPTMGGLIILLSLGGAVLLWGDLTNTYVQLVLIATLWMGAVGFADDYIKVVLKEKTGLAERTKLIGQIGLGLFLGTVLYFLPEFSETRSLTSVPFVRNGYMDYDFLTALVNSPVDLGWLIYIPVVVFILTGVSNAVNLTDGLDGLTTGVSAFVALGLVALVYITGNIQVAGFLNELYVPDTGELTVFAAALGAACFGFLWYNGYPAQVFMGDTGSLALGAAIGSLAIMAKKELLLPVLCGVFVIETLSVILQTVYFKYSRRKYGEGRRIFRMAPLHHHYEALGMPESKIVIRFWIISALLVIATFLILRIR